MIMHIKRRLPPPIRVYSSRHRLWLIKSIMGRWDREARTRRMSGD